jgi:hypothetical protein
MVKCNTCGFIGVWHGKTIVDQNGKKHICLEFLKRDTFIDDGLEYEYADEIDATVPRQVRTEGNTWTLYRYGKVFKVRPKVSKKK